MAEFTQEQITKLVQRYVLETLQNDEKCRAISGPTADGTMTLPGMTILESSDMKADEAESMLKSVNRWLKNQDHSLMKPVTEKLIKAEGAEVIPEGENYKTLVRELLKAFQGIQIRKDLPSRKGDASLPGREYVKITRNALASVRQ
jgi:hypothetical protein